MKIFKNKLIRSALAIFAGAAFVLPPTIVNAEIYEIGVTNSSLDKKDANISKTDGYTGAVPSASQYKYHKEGLAAFCHFGPNTFNNVEWGDRYGDRAPDDIFPLTEKIDADLYVKTLKDAGFSRLIVTAKHHDGFCLWKSAYTDYDIESTNYPGDVLEDISIACTKYDMDMGLYLSPWDIHEKSYGYYDADRNPVQADKDVLDYNIFYNNQLKEILSNDIYGNNGKFSEIWLDGAKGSGADAQEYTPLLWEKTIDSYEKDCLIFGSILRNDVRWIGNERGYAADTTWAQGYFIDSNGNRVENPSDAISIDTNISGGYSHGYKYGNAWSVPECDARLTPGWFWGPYKSTPKSASTLTDMYFGSVGHNAVLLLNVPLNNKGTLDENIKTSVSSFGYDIKNTFSNNLVADKNIYASDVYDNSVTYSPLNVADGKNNTAWAPSGNNGSLIIDLGSPTEFDIISLEEAIEYGQRISSYSITCSNDRKNWASLENGTTVGSKRLCRPGKVCARYIKISVETDANTLPVLSEVGVYKGSGAFEQKNIFTSGELKDVNVFNFPENKSDASVLEAETATLFNTYAGSGTERWPLETASAGWASGSTFVNACNEGDVITFDYNAAKSGTYEFMLTYRSGDSRNAFTLTEENGKIEPIFVPAGNSNPYITKNAVFSVRVLQPGQGKLILKAGEFKAPQMDKFDITLKNTDFVFPDVTGGQAVLEAETATLFNTFNGSGTERWSLGVVSSDWASDSAFVNACNEGDYISFDYYAPEIGNYEFILTYRSGDPRNAFTLTEENGKIEPVYVSAGNYNPYVTKQASFNVNILKKGHGRLILKAGDFKAPQLDKFDIIFK